MGDHDAEAAIAKLVGGRAEILAEARERGLYEQPAATWGSLRDQLELRLAETADHVVAQLATAEDLDLDPLTGQPVLDLAHALGQLLARREEVRADVRGRDDGAGALGESGRRELDALLDRLRAVVDAREEMEVDIRVAHMPSMFGADGGNAVSIL